MNSFMDKLGLRPAERRLLVGVGVVLFIVLNIYLVWPHFKDWGRLKGEIAGLKGTLALYQQERDKLPEYQAKEAELRGQSPEVPVHGIGVQLVKELQSRATRAGLRFAYLKQSDGRKTDRSEFFEEKVVNVRFTGWTDTNLLKFLVSLGEGGSVIRIRDLTIKPDPTRMRLTGNATMVASFQKAAPQ